MRWKQGDRELEKGKGDGGMTPRAIHQLIGKALTERSFREQLLEQPQVAMLDFPLSDAEQDQIATLKAIDLEEFSRLLSERLHEPEGWVSGS